MTFSLRLCDNNYSALALAVVVPVEEKAKYYFEVIIEKNVEFYELEEQSKMLPSRTYIIAHSIRV